MVTSCSSAASNALQPPLNHVLGVDDHVQQYLELLLAQESIRAGAWLDAAAILSEGAEGPWSGPHRVRSDFWRGAPRLHFDPEWQGQRRKLLDELALRAETRPIDVAERRRIGRAPHVLPTPLDPAKRASLFWRDHDLCVAQEGDPPRSMKCYDPVRRRWRAPSPISWPKLDGTLLEEPRPNQGEPWDRCEPPQTMQMGIKGDRLDTDCWYDPNQIVALLEGPSLLLSGLLLQPKDGYNERPIDAGRATALIAASSGSRAVGQGCCWLEPEHDLLVELDGGQRSWELIGAPPRGESWVGSALASPDQSFIALQSKGSGDDVRIWLLRVAPHEKH